MSPETDRARALLAMCQRVEQELTTELVRLELAGFFPDSMAVRHWTALRDDVRTAIAAATGGAS